MMTTLYRYAGAHYRAAQLEEVLDYRQLQCRSGGSGSVRAWLIRVETGYGVVVFMQDGAIIKTDLLYHGPDRQKAEHAFGLWLDNVQQGTGSRFGECEHEIISVEQDQKAQKILQALTEPGGFWDPGWGEAATDYDPEQQELQEFVQILDDQLRRWKGSWNPMHALRHRAWPRFHELVVRAVQDQLGDPVWLYRGVYGDPASQVLDGGPLPMRHLSSWTLDRRYAKDFVLTTPGGADMGRSQDWVTVRAEWPADAIVFAPVEIPELERFGLSPDMLVETFDGESECVVWFQGERLQPDEFQMIHRTRRQRKQRAPRPKAARYNRRA